MRRLIIEEPISRAALWSRQIAWFALAVTLISVAVLRFGVVDLVPGFVALATGLGLAGLAIALALGAFLRIWTEGRRGVGAAVGGVLLAGLILALPAFYGLRGLLLPAITDVTTDVAEPPTFSRSRQAFAARDGHVPPEQPPEARVKQQEAYPQIAPLSLDLPAEQAFALAREAALKRGWQIVEEVKPGGRMGVGRIEAIDRSFLMRLPHDVTVRIRPRADGSRIDVRAASRVGWHDLGSNARRVRRYLDEVSELAIAAPE